MASVCGFTVCVQEDGLLSVQKTGCLATLARNPGAFQQVKAEGTFESIASMQQKLDDLHLLVQSGGVCVMVEGCGGCGKSALLKAYARTRGYSIGDNLVVVHLGEQIDGKMLLGTFTCTNTPGEFVWLPGVLTKAVAGGRWVILEDVDAAPPDVISLLLPLVKSRRLMIPGYAEPLQAAPGFMLFLTRRVDEGDYSQLGGLLSILRQHSSLLHLPPLSPEETKQVIQAHYPSLQLLSDRMVQACSSVNIPLRCLLKLCERVSPQVYNGRISSVEDLMLELVDCFCGHLPVENRLSLALELKSLCGGIAKEKVEQLCTMHKPSLHISPTTVTVGRAYLPRNEAKELRLCYAHTQGSLRLLESVCRCVQMNEPVLLVGETGVGKTATVNYLAGITGNKLVVMNMSQQTGSTDLLGGFKPVQVTQLVAPVREEFEQLFHATFSVKQNAQFLASIQVCFAKQQWKKLFKLMSHSLESALKRLKGPKGDDSRSLASRWKILEEKLKKLRRQMSKAQTTFAFAFVEGALVEAVRQGWWILLDEINLASAETLQCLSSLLEGPDGSFLLAEKGDSRMVERHPNFRLFCCMNPATDIGKRTLPQSIRSRFTELFVDELQNTEDLRLLVLNYLKDVSPNPTVVDSIIKLYHAIKELAQNRLRDGTGRKPHYSLRSLCRALVYAASNHCGMFLRSLYEGFCMSFLTEVCQDHHHLVTTEIQRCLGVSDRCISGKMSCPKREPCVQVEGFWLPTGSEAPQTPEEYILTPSVKRNLRNLARAVSARQHPVLLQGPTSAGKTSLIQYLARVTGHKCVRINNHEHTDLQEYVGMYTASSKGQLIFQEGILVNAMRNGYWIILDELNLAPTDVLEALNRVLDDNRELFIPETQELVKANSHFLLFGTQNPPGLYGGRKVLSQAFRNRFIELHFDDLPAVELVTILHQKSQLPQSYAKKMVAVMKDLQQRRSYSGVFAGKYGLITLRDLFRWAERYRKSENAEERFYDWEKHLAEDGFMLLGGRLQNRLDEEVIQEVIQKHFKRAIYPLVLFGHDGGDGSLTSRQTLQLLKQSPPHGFNHLVWIPELLKMAVLLHRALQFDEPVLLVGNTGCGKTTLCHWCASILGKHLFSINCHMHTEAADFLGGLRPVRNKSNTDGDVKSALFEWTDGIVVQAMTSGSCVLIDEISLAEDAVLERLNSVLEPERTLLVAERSRHEEDVYEVVAQDGFVFMATMNPGGDYGKKELSPALRNRFVEIWCPSATAKEGYMKIIEHNLATDLVPLNSVNSWSTLMLDFIEWMRQTLHASSSVISIRDLLAWVNFMNTLTPQLTPEEAFYHGAHLVFLDAMGCGSTGDGVKIKSEAIQFLMRLMETHGIALPGDDSGSSDMEGSHEGLFGIPPFFIERGTPEHSPFLLPYTLEAPGPHANAFRILRAMQLGKPLLLEGAPGVGKTSLVTALAQASGHSVTRINLSEHTDVSDLFGSDLPVEGGRGVNFAWRDGPFLKALKNGNWILLDEMNLASQSVLEGLNACLDHRGEVYIPELGMTFKVQQRTRLFACQNPLHQGGGRKGLPKSFLNRFTQVYMDVLSTEDLLFIVSTLYPSIEHSVLLKMITFNAKVEALVKKECGGMPWEFNLRDVLRWCELMLRHQDPTCLNPGLFVDIIYCRRLRSDNLRDMVLKISRDDFCLPPLPLGSYFQVAKETVQVGHTILHRENYIGLEDDAPPLLPLHCQMPVLEALMICVQMGWMAILVGGSCSGKCSVVRTLANLTGHKLLEFPMNSDTDATELLGGFEQVNFSRHCSNLASVAMDVARYIKGSLVREGTDDPACQKLHATLDVLSKNLSTDFSPAVCLKDCNPQEVTVWCRELKTILQELSDISSQLNTSLPYSIPDLLMQVEELSKKSQEIDTSGQFEWVDSVLVKALEHGHWLLISNANFCSPSVLDRLNPLLEPNGVLSIDGRGIVGDSVPTVTPHPNFRLFLSLDPSHGEISRAMRNRGIEIFILPEESVYVLDRHHNDWISLLSAQTHCDNAVSNTILQMCSGITGVGVNQALQAAKCYQLLHNLQQEASHDFCLTKACQLVGIPKVSNFLEENCDLSNSVRSLVDVEAVTVKDCILYPEHTTVYRDIASILKCLNLASFSRINCNRDKSLDSDKLISALEVFVTNASLEDHQIRMSSLNHLLSLTHSIPWASVEMIAATEVLAVAMKHPDIGSYVMEIKKKYGFFLNSFIALVNPHISCLVDVDRHHLFSFTSRLSLQAKSAQLLTIVQQHSKQVCFGDKKSVIQLSHDLHFGILPLQLSTNSSFVYIYPFLCALLNSLQSVSVAERTDSTLIDETLHSSLDWVSMFVRICMAPGCALSTIAVAWNLLLGKCIEIILPFIEMTSEFQLLQSFLKGLQGLANVVKQGELFAAVRKVMGHARRPLQHSLDIKDQVETMDCQLRKNTARLPFLMLTDLSLVDQRRNLCQALFRAHLAEWSNPTDGIESELLQNKHIPVLEDIEEDKSNRVSLATALQPSVHCLKKLTVDVFSASWEYWRCSLAQVQSLLDYCLQLSGISVNVLKPLIVLEGCCISQDYPRVNHDVKFNILTSLLPGLLECCCSGFSALEQISLATDGEASPLLLVESSCSKMCFSMLPPHSCWEEFQPEYIHPVTLSIGNHLVKVEELKALLQHLWLHGCSTVYNPHTTISHELDVNQVVLRLLTRAVRYAVQKEDSLLHAQSEIGDASTDPSSETISAVCNFGGQVYPASINWNVLKDHLVSAHNELVSVNKVSQQHNFTYSMHSELSALYSLSSAKIHLGVSLCLVLCPPPVDPVALDNAHYQCINQLAKQSQCLVEAWDHHYESMIGKQIHELLDMTEADLSDNITLLRNCGLAPNVVSLLEKRKLWTNRLHGLPLDNMTQMDEKKYTSLVNLCNDILGTVCAPDRIQSMLSAAKEIPSGGTIMQQVISWTNAVSVAISRLKNGFGEYLDVVEPFVMALHQIIHGVNSLVWLKSQIQGNLPSMVEFAIQLIQFPFFSSTTYGCLQWVKLLTSIAASGMKGIVPEQWPRVQKRIILLCISACKTSLKTLPELSPSWRDIVWCLLELCGSLWLQCEEKERERARKEESLYRFKTKTHQIAESEDTIEEVQLRTLFPSFEKDFADTVENEELSSIYVDNPQQCYVQFTPQEMEQICSLHMWACGKWYGASYDSPEVKPPLQEAYYLARDVSRMAGSLPGCSCDYFMMSGHTRVWSEILTNLQQGSGDGRPTNIYKEPAVYEVKRALPVITELRTRIKELLLEWPDHPGLKQINEACEKVLSLSIHEPLMKILSGLEYVLRKAQEWEAFASSHVSLGKQLQPLTQLILDWRKIELNSWKGLLLACDEEMKTASGKWWFHLRSLCHSQTTEDIQDFTIAVQTFVETSSVGEFGHRIHLLKAFNREMLQKGCSNVASVLDNTFHFYSQFLPAVNTAIQQLTGPLEKEFKEYLSILRWNDGNYWAIKAATEKSHRTLVKFVNKYKGILQQPVRSLLTDASLCDGVNTEESCIEGAEPTLHDLLRKESYVSELNVEVHSMIGIQMEENSAETTTGDAFVRMRKLVQHFTTSDLCAKQSVVVDSFTGTIVAIHKNLESAEFLKGLDGGKRKTAIKLSNAQKRKALSDLFRALKQQGLSHQKKNDFGENINLIAFKLPTVEPPREESCISKLLSCVHKCYYCCLARMISFQTAVQKPSKELTFGQVSRCKGYAYYLMTLVCEQNTLVAESVSSLQHLKHTLECFGAVVKEEEELCIEGTQDFIHWQSSLSTCLEQCLEGTYSFSALVSTMPEMIDFTLTPFTKDRLPPIVACGNKVVTEEAVTILMSHTEELNDLYATTVRKEKENRRYPPHFITRLEIEELKKGFSAVQKFIQSTTKVLSLTFEESGSLGMFEFLGALQKQLIAVCKEFAEWLEQFTVATPTSVQSSYSNQVNKVIKMILLAVQRVMNRHKDDCCTLNTSEGDLNEDFAHCKYLHAATVENLKDMKANEVLSELESLLLATPLQETKPAFRMLSAVYPLLHQYTKLYEKLLSDLLVAHQILCKLLSVLLQLFSTLSAKGFCTPPEETESGESTGTELVNMDAGGFDEGEGNKNVSNDADPNNLDAVQSREEEQGERSEQPEYDHEEDAVEMSTEFEGSMEDVGEEEEQSDQSEGEEDHEKQMGELGSGDGEQLDKNMWAPEEEEDQQNLEDLEQDNSGNGTAIENETKIVAKDDNQESLHVQSREPQQAGEEEMEPEQGEDVPPSDELSQFDTGIPELEDLDIDDEEECSDGGEDFVEPAAGEFDGSDEEGGEDIDEEREGPEINEKSAELNEEDHIHSTADINSHTGVDKDTLQSSVDLLCDEPNGKESQEENQGQSTDTSTELNGKGGGGTSVVPVPENEMQESESVSQRKSLGRHCDEYTLDDSEKSAVKRPKLMGTNQLRMESTKIPNRSKESALYQHLRAESNSENDLVAWDAAPTERFEQPLPHVAEEETSLEGDRDKEEDMDVTQPQQLLGPHQLGSDVVDSEQPLPEPKESGTGPDRTTKHQQESVYLRESFFGGTNLPLLEPAQPLDDNSVRESLKSAVSVLHNEQQSVDASQLWLKYEALTSNLSQMLCEELRLVLQPTQAAQLKGDYRTGKRLNMRRIIPYIASNFQNDRIWLRRSKPSKRVYQILIAVDDSSSMSENDCDQMAYETLALISNSLNRLDCGQLGICRFGTNVEVLHPLDQPFSTRSGGFVLQNLSFTQTQTNFKELLQAAESIFAKFLSKSTNSSPDISQLLVVLSDGRGVFADGTYAVDLAMRRLNKMGVFTVFVILDNLLKDSVVDIKVPTFSPGKPPVIRTYLETFPFPFYIVLREIETLPMVLGQALKQWFELVHNRTSAFS